MRAPPEGVAHDDRRTVQAADDVGEVLDGLGDGQVGDDLGALPEGLDLDLEPGVGRCQDGEPLLLVAVDPALPAAGRHPQSVDEDDGVGRGGSGRVAHGMASLRESMDARGSARSRSRSVSGGRVRCPDRQEACVGAGTDHTIGKRSQRGAAGRENSPSRRGPPSRARWGRGQSTQIPAPVEPLGHEDRGEEEWPPESRHAVRSAERRRAAGASDAAGSLTSTLPERLGFRRCARARSELPARIREQQPEDGPGEQVDPERHGDDDQDGLGQRLHGQESSGTRLFGRGPVEPRPV